MMYSCALWSDEEGGVNGDGDLPVPNLVYPHGEDTGASTAVSAETAVSFDRIDLFAADSGWGSGTWHGQGLPCIFRAESGS